MQLLSGFLIATQEMGFHLSAALLGGSLMRSQSRGSFRSSRTVRWGLPGLVSIVFRIYVYDLLHLLWNGT